MFQSKPLVPPREVDAARHRLAALNRHASGWFDGTVGSVDARIAAVADLLGRYRRLAAADPDGEHVATALALEDDARRLHAMREELFANHAEAEQVPRAAAVAPVTARVRRFVATAVNAFLADNTDAAHDGVELDVRAHHFVHARTGTLPPEEAATADALFRREVAARVRPAAPVKEAAAPATDFADELIFD